MSDALRAPVREFVDALTDTLAQLAAGDHKGTATVEAYDLVCGFVDADGNHTDEELWALISAFGPLMETQLYKATPADVRLGGLVAGKRYWLEQPSALFDTLLQADVARGTAYAWRYYTHALRLAHHVVALDSFTQHAELDAIERFRRALLKAMDAAKVERGPRGGAAPRTPTRQAAQAETAAATEAAVVAEEAEALPPARPLEELYAELDALIGLEPVKTEVKLVADLLRVQQLRAERGLKVPRASRHLIFTGNPGTGKTTVARLLAQIYRTLGVVPKGHLVETDRSGLVAGFVGQTATKVGEVFERARGGVLLIDEAYSLVRGGEKDFGREAVDAIVKLVEDRREDTVVIMAGYPGEMSQLIDANPGLRSRFPKTIHFPDYSTDELIAIADMMCKGAEYRFDDSARERLRSVLDAAPRDRGFGNGRLVRNLFEAAIARHAGRVVALPDPTAAELSTLTAEDIPDLAVAAEASR